MFAGSDRGGERAAVIYSMVATCKLSGVDPHAWLARRRLRAHRRASRRPARRSVGVELARRRIADQSCGLTGVFGGGVTPPVLGGCLLDGGRIAG